MAESPKSFCFPSYNSKLLWHTLKTKLEYTVPDLLFDEYENAILIRKPGQLSRVIISTDPENDSLVVRFSQDLSAKVNYKNGVDHELTKGKLLIIFEMIVLIVGIKAPSTYAADPF